MNDSRWTNDLVTNSRFLFDNKANVYCVWLLNDSQRTNDSVTNLWQTACVGRRGNVDRSIVPQNLPVPNIDRECPKTFPIFLLDKGNLLGASSWQDNALLNSCLGIGVDLLFVQFIFVQRLFIQRFSSNPFHPILT